MKANSGASKHFIRQKDAHIVKNKVACDGPTVILPDMSKLKSTISGTLDIKQLSPKANKAHILPNLRSASLLSMGQLCDDNCVVTLDKQNMFVTKNNEIVLRGKRNKFDGLWDVQLSTEPLKANVIIQKSTLKRDLAIFIKVSVFHLQKRLLYRLLKTEIFWDGQD